jgi:hypothetical protein
MPNNDPERPDQSSEPTLTGDTLRRLEERLDRASEAAERLIAEVAAEAASVGARSGAAAARESDAGAANQPPPAGWQRPHGDGRRGAEDDLEVLGQVIQAVRDLIPADLQRRLAAALRELLLALRALIDFYLERIERRAEAAPEVEDIPIS